MATESHGNTRKTPWLIQRRAKRVRQMTFRVLPYVSVAILSPVSCLLSPDSSLLTPHFAPLTEPNDRG